MSECGRIGIDTLYEVVRGVFLLGVAVPVTALSYQVHAVLDGVPSLVHWTLAVVPPVLALGNEGFRAWWDGVIVHAVIIGSVLGAVLAAAL